MPGSAERPGMDLAPGAWRYAAPAFVAAVPAVLATPLASLACVLLGVAVLAFFRDPARTPPDDGFVSPADGTVSVIRTEGDRLRVGVFMNVDDVHVNRAPTDGVVERVEHVPGAHRPAFTKDSERNERVHVEFPAYRVTLIAGAFARRIHPYLSGGEALARGDRIGHIAFGSRADVLLPPEVERWDLRVSEGDTVRAGESVLADDPRE